MIGPERAFEADLVRLDGVGRIRLRGDLDLLAHPSLSAVVDAALHWSPEIVFDLSEVRLIDGAGALALADAARRSRAHGGSPRAENTPPLIARVLIRAAIDPATLDDLQDASAVRSTDQARTRRGAPSSITSPDLGSSHQPTEPFDARIVAAIGGTELHLCGEFDLAGVTTFDAAAAQLDDHIDAVLDLRELTFIDSTGLERLLRLQGRLEAQGHKIVLRHPHRQLLRLIELSGTLTAFDLDGATAPPADAVQRSARNSSSRVSPR
jgi:anti-sigma B factor antagonist